MRSQDPVEVGRHRGQRLPAPPARTPSFATSAEYMPSWRHISPTRAPLLLVALHHVLRAGLGVAGILAGVALGPPLAKEVPTLVELDLQLPQPVIVVLAQRVAGGRLVVQPVFFVNELID